jgi:hypothetical protein
MGQGYVANTDALAIRVGELRAVAGEVEAVCLGLDVSAGDLGPGGIAGAVQEVVGEWRDRLGDLTDKIDTIAGNVSAACANYADLERRGADAMRSLAESTVTDQVFQGLQQASPVYQQQRQQALMAQNAAKTNNMRP